MENKFKSIFQILQFNIEIKSINKYMLMINPVKPVFRDITDELALEKELEEKIKQSALEM